VFVGYLTPYKLTEDLLDLTKSPTEQGNERAGLKERENKKLRERKKAYDLGEEFTYFLQQKLKTCATRTYTHTLAHTTHTHTQTLCRT